ncbi:MAG: hypothetical protein JST65_15685 [Acidobacteria bacterium]|nr:hypothetical protein [Acidobacteriota bacterium]
MKNVLVALCAAALLHGQTPPYQLVVLRGDNAQNNIKKGRATKQVVEVRDRNNKPVAGVLLTFSLPKTGASGTFVDGSQLATVTTDNVGQASVTVQPNSVAGTYQIDVSGNVGGNPVSGKITQTNVAAAAGVSGTTIGILAAVAAAGAAVGIGLAVSGNGNSSTSATPPGVRIGVGSGVTVTAPR